MGQAAAGGGDGPDFIYIAAGWGCVQLDGPGAKVHEYLKLYPVVVLIRK